MPVTVTNKWIDEVIRTFESNEDQFLFHNMERPVEEKVIAVLKELRRARKELCKREKGIGDEVMMDLSESNRKSLMTCHLKLVDDESGQEIGSWPISIIKKRYQKKRNQGSTTPKEIQLLYIPGGAVFKDAVKKYLNWGQE